MKCLKNTFVWIALMAIQSWSAHADIIQSGDVQDFDGSILVGFEDEGSWTVNNGTEATIKGLYAASRQT